MQRDTSKSPTANSASTTSSLTLRSSSSSRQRAQNPFALRFAAHGKTGLRSGGSAAAVASSLSTSWFSVHVISSGSCELTSATIMRTVARLVKILERPAGQQFAPFQGPLESAMRLGSTSSTITTRGIIKARRICCCSQPATSYLSPSAKVRSRPVPKLGPFEIDHKSAA